VSLNLPYWHRSIYFCLGLAHKLKSSDSIPYGLLLLDEQALAKFDEAAFVAAGYAPIVRSQFIQMQAEEATHISFLSSAIVSQAQIHRGGVANSDFVSTLKYFLNSGRCSCIAVHL
jgi:hypothetical protein